MFFIYFLVIHGTDISWKAPGGSLWIKDYRIIYFLYVEDNATIFFWQGIVLPCFFSQKIVSLRENSLKICKTVRNEEPTVRTWERQWNHVTLGETVRVERSVLIKIIFSISILSSNFRIWLDLNNGLEWESQTENSYFLRLSFMEW